MDELLLSAAKITACFIDLDNTLWQGIIAEGQTPRLYQERLKVLQQLSKLGIQLYVVSKNELTDVEAAFSKLLTFHT